MTLQEIAATKGWTLEVTGEKAQTFYTFTKGLITISYNRAGHGHLHVSWDGWTVPWRPSFQIGEAWFSIGSRSREEYIEAILPLVTEEECLRRIDAALTHDVEEARKKLQAAETRLQDFHVARNHG